MEIAAIIYRMYDFLTFSGGSNSVSAVYEHIMREVKPVCVKNIELAIDYGLTEGFLSCNDGTLYIQNVCSSMIREVPLHNLQRIVLEILENRILTHRQIICEVEEKYSRSDFQELQKSTQIVLDALVNCGTLQRRNFSYFLTRRAHVEQKEEAPTVQIVSRSTADETESYNEDAPHQADEMGSSQEDRDVPSTQADEIGDSEEGSDTLSKVTQKTYEGKQLSVCVDQIRQSEVIENVKSVAAISGMSFSITGSSPTVESVGVHTEEVLSELPEPKVEDFTTMVDDSSEIVPKERTATSSKLTVTTDEEEAMPAKRHKEK